MKKVIIVFFLLVFFGCKKNEKDSGSDFQKKLLTLGQEYVEYKKTHHEFDDYKAYHDTILVKMRELTKQKRLDTVTVKVIKIDLFSNESYDVTYQDGAFVYRAQITFRNDIDIRKSPFYEYKQTLKIGQVVDLPIYMYETSSLGLETNATAQSVFNMSEGSIEIYVWPIPEGVDDIKLQMQKDLLNTWRNTTTSFE